MSYDLQIWSIRQPLRDDLKPGLTWADAPRAWTYSRRNWLINISHPVRVEAEDIPPEIASQLPGISFLTEINLEGDFALSVVSQATAIGKFMAGRVHGLVLDPQRECVLTPPGVRRIEQARVDERFDVLDLSFWFLGSPFLTEIGRRHVLDLLESTLPEALPRRYGTFEPPEFKYEDSGRSHFEQFWTQNLHEVLVWRSKRPVVSVHSSCPCVVGATNKGFTANHFEVQVEHSALSQPGWQIQLSRLWIALCGLLCPFYGDVRILRNQPKDGYFGENDETHPVRSIWWRGIPKVLGCAMFLGEEYQALWPEAMRSAEMRGDLRFISTNDWSKGETVEAITGSVPEEISSRPFVWPASYSKLNAPINSTESYPEKWPFGNPFGPSNPWSKSDLKNQVG
jgi:hypothetical protein